MFGSTAFVNGSSLCSFTPRTIGSTVCKTRTNSTVLNVRSRCSRVEVRKAFDIRCEDDTKFAKPQPGDPDFNEDLPKVSEQDLEESPTDEGLASRSKTENEPAWMDTSSFKEATEDDKKNATTGVDVSDSKDV